MPVLGNDWTFTGQPGDSDLDHVRVLLGDTRNDDQLLGDSIISWALTEYGNPRKAASACARILAAEYARLVDKGGSAGANNSEKSKQYNDLAEQIEKGVVVLAKPFGGGISVSDKEAREDDTNRVPSEFFRNQWDNNG